MDARDVVKELAAAWIAHDNARIAAIFGADGRFEDPLHPRTLVGEADVLATNQAAVDDLTDIDVELFWVLGSATRAVAEGRMAATFVEGGTRMEFPFTMVAETESGQVTRVTEYFDTHPLVG